MLSAADAEGFRKVQRVAMSETGWREVPVGLDAHRWVTRTNCRTMLVAVHTMTSGQRLLDVIRLVESDLRIQVVFTIAPDVFSDGVAELLHDLGAAVVPWAQAVRLDFDLAVAAAYGSVHELHAPLIVLPHGAGHNKLVARRASSGATAARSVYGLDMQRIVRDGCVVPTALVLAHKADLTCLARQCPEALPVAVVAGDPCYDRLMASKPHRVTYRDALGVTTRQKLIIVSSTWGPRSLFGRSTAVLDRLLAGLPADEYRIVVAMHPNVWFAHGPWQVRAWLAAGVRRGLALMPPTADWRAVLAAADVLIADHGSLGVYGAAVNVPVMLASFALVEVSPVSPAAMLAAIAPRLRHDRPVLGQIRDAVGSYRAADYAPVAARITSEPGRFGQNMRRLLYRLLGLKPPAVTSATPPADLPFLVS